MLASIEVNQSNIEQGNNPVILESGEQVNSAFAYDGQGNRYYTSMTDKEEIAALRTQNNTALADFIRGDL